MENKIIKSPDCKTENIKKDGKRKTENRGLIHGVSNAIPVITDLLLTTASLE